MKYLLAGTLLLSLMISCNNEKESTSSKSIMLDKVEVALPLDSIFSGYEIFNIQDPLFGYVFYVEEVGDKLVVKAENDNFGILLFDPATATTKALAKIGNGPGEFRTPGMPEKSVNGFFLADRMKKRVIEFSREGDLLQTVDLPFQFDRLIMKDYPLVYSFLSLGNSPEKGKDHEIIIYDLSSDSTLAKYLPLDNDVAVERGIAGYYPLHVVNDEVVLFRPLRDTIYTIARDAISTRYIIDSGGRGVPQDFLNNPEVGLVEFFETMKDSDYFWFYIDYQETENHVYITYTKNMERCSAFFDKRTGRTSLSKGFLDNMIFGKEFSYHDFMPVGKGENCMYFAADPLAILGNDILIPGMAGHDLINSLAEEDNRLIIKLYFK
ncbi:MAG: 6-bladed beta-propeller [Marinilabiliaceae bacterium]|jgi:hypothetical protein|nr:6-bladed beta-propeller [Marinilabiliaceae bacterium]